MFALSSSPKLKRGMTRAAAKRGSDFDAAAVARIDKELQALAVDYGSGSITRAEWKAARDRLNKRRAKLIDAAEPPHERRATNALRAAPDVAAAWDAMPVENRRAVIAELYEYIKVGPTRRPGSNAFDPRRVARDWRA